MKPRRTGRFPDNINCGYPLIHLSCAHLNAYYRRWVWWYPAVIPALGGWGGKRWVWNGYALGCKNRVQGTLELQTEHLPGRNKTTLCWHWFFWIKKKMLYYCVCTTALRLEDSFVQSLLSFYICESSRDWTQVTRLAQQAHLPTEPSYQLHFGISDEGRHLRRFSSVLLQFYFQNKTSGWNFSLYCHDNIFKFKVDPVAAIIFLTQCLCLTCAL